MIARSPKLERRSFSDAGNSNMDQDLFDRLRALRKRLAEESGLPPYVVFHDSTLRKMAEHKPLELEQFAALPGVGRSKLDRYGPQFIAVIRDYRGEQSRSTISVPR
jgi:ATP-dependent DNA helicase RecQ